jgi:hypothetical protein
MIKELSKGVLASIILLNLVIALAPPQSEQQSQYDCSNETNPLKIKIIELNQTLFDTQNNLTHYFDLFNRYKLLYESKEVNITHGELIQIFNTLNQLNFNYNQTNQTLNDIQNKFSIFTFEVGISILGVTGISVGFIELTLWYFKRRKKHEKTSG